MREFDKFLSENSVYPVTVIIHPSAWDGHWSVVKRPKWFKVFRIVGRFLKNRNVYWLGLSIYWVDGLKTVFPEGGVPVEIKDTF